MQVLTQECDIHTFFIHYENLVYKNHQAQILVQNFSEHSKELEHILSQAF